MKILPGVCLRVRAAMVTVLILASAPGGDARAQVAAPPPGPPPLTEPSVPNLPGAPSALVAIPAAVATPLQTPVPVPTPAPTPAPRLFNCSCFTTGTAVEWSGFVSSTNYAAARSAASGACIAYLTRGAQSPFIPPGQSPGLNSTVNNESTGAPSSSSASSSNPAQAPGTTVANTPLSELENSPSLTGQSACNVCACN